jgi:hypothetical protein
MEQVSEKISQSGHGECFGSYRDPIRRPAGMPEEVSQVSAAASPASTAEALGMLTAAMRYLATTDPVQLTAGEQAQCLRTLEQVDAMETAARASFLGAFTTAKGYCDDGAYSARAWLIHQTRVTKGTAARHTGWDRRLRAHPRLAAVLAAGELTESYAAAVCHWTGQLPEDCRDSSDAILTGAALTGMDLRDLAALAAEIQARADPGTGDDDDPGPVFEDRAVRLETTFGGAGVMTGDLTPECAAVVRTVLDALSAPRGAEDTRSHQQRYHDALEDAMRRLISADLLPERAGQPARALAHISLADLREADAGSELQKKWAERVRGEWAAHRAAASVSGSDGGAWLEAGSAEAFACDASITPVVTGEVNPAALDYLVRLCLELAGHSPRHCHPGSGSEAEAPEGGQSGPTPPPAQTQATGTQAPGPQAPAGQPGGPAWQCAPVPPTARGRAALEQAIIGQAVALVSGPGGLASFLRRGLLGARLAGPSLPLDVGVSKDIPAAIRRLVIQRDQHCRFPGGCDQPAAACEVHHITHQANGGKTSVSDCALFCFFHHHVAIHQWGWTVVLNPDGTTTAYSPDKTKILHSHGPPPAPPG